jgi:hypothetical protein
LFAAAQNLENLSEIQIVAVTDRVSLWIPVPSLAEPLSLEPAIRRMKILIYAHNV